MVRLFDGGGGQALHGAGDLLADLGQDLGVVVVGGGDDDGLGAATASSRSSGLRGCRLPLPQADLGSSRPVSTSRGVARSFMKMPEPTKMASAPSCIMRAASAGVAMPPAEKLGTGSLPVWATMRMSS